MTASAPVSRIPYTVRSTWIIVRMTMTMAVMASGDILRDKFRTGWSKVSFLKLPTTKV